MVRADDPAFANPTKFVGPVYHEARARQLAAACGWAIGQDGRAWRRVVPSPEPLQVVESGMVMQLTGPETIVVCAGGGGIPVVRDGADVLHGVEAVVDKDLTASLLARLLAADALLILTDVNAVEDGYGTRQARPIRQTTAAASPLDSRPPEQPGISQRRLTSSLAASQGGVPCRRPHRHRIAPRGAAGAWRLG